MGGYFAWRRQFNQLLLLDRGLELMTVKGIRGEESLADVVSLLVWGNSALVNAALPLTAAAAVAWSLHVDKPPLK